MKAPFWEIIKRNLWIKTGIKILMFLLVALMYLDGLHYPQCMCIFPDEILDLSFSFLPYQVEIEKGILCEESNEQTFNLVREIQIFSVQQTLKIKNNSLNTSLISNEFLVSQGFKKRLSSLQQYNC
ncbi:MAG: hypothetical protein ACMUIU_01905 [bacterium]